MALSLSTIKALEKAGLKIEDIGAFEINEAFAVQVLAFLDHFGIADDDPRVNPYGGAIAVGHPLASSGVRLMLNLARTFEEKPDVRYGITTMCIGLGMGGTVIWENPHFTGGKKIMATAIELPEGAPEEVVTHALVRDVDLTPFGYKGSLALITLDNGLDHTRPNTFGPHISSLRLRCCHYSTAASRKASGHRNYRKAIYLCSRSRFIWHWPFSIRCESQAVADWKT
jgi:hypothetical protein